MSSLKILQKSWGNYRAIEWTVLLYDHLETQRWEDYRKILLLVLAILCYSGGRGSLQRGPRENPLAWITAKQPVPSGAPEIPRSINQVGWVLSFMVIFFCLWSLYILTQSKCQKLLLWGRLNTPRADLNFLSYIRFHEDRLPRWASTLIYFLFTHRSSVFFDIPFCHWTHHL